MYPVSSAQGPVSLTQGSVSITEAHVPKPKEQKRKPAIFSIPHQFTENWIRIEQIAKLIGRKK
jgi:hypothetical protein